MHRPSQRRHRASAAGRRDERLLQHYYEHGRRNERHRRPVAIAVDASENLFIAGAYTGNFPGLREYAAPYTTTPNALFGQQISSTQMDVDAANELVMNQDQTSIIVALPPYTTYTALVNGYGNPTVLGESTRFTLGK